MHVVTLVLKGMVYGITHIVPGLGGGLILILMGIYEQFVEAIGNFFLEKDKLKEHLMFLVPVGVGMVIGMVIFAKLVTALLEAYPSATMFFFMGLLIGTIPAVFKMHDDMKPTASRGAALLLGLALVVVLKQLDPGTGHGGGQAMDLSGVGGTLYNFVIAFFGGGASVTPGLDGSYVLLLGGTYEPAMAAISNLMHLQIDWALLGSLGIGAVLGILIISKLIDLALKRIPALSYYCVLGLILGSVYGLWPTTPARVGVVVLVLAFVVGAVVAWVTSREPETASSPAHEPAESR